MKTFAWRLFALVAVLLLSAGHAINIPHVNNVFNKLPALATDRKLGLSIGTTAGGEDVVFHDVVSSTFAAPEEMTIGEVYIVPADKDFVTFYAVRDANSAPLTLQKPVVVVTAEYSVVMDATVSMPGGVMLHVPERTADSTVLDEASFTVQFECDGAGFNDIVVRLRVLDLLSNKQAREPIVFFFRKECATGDKEIKGSALPNLFVGTSESRHDVLQNGEATSAWEIKGDGDDVETVVDAHIVDTEFFVSFDEKECLKNWESASVVVFNPEIVEVEVVGDFADDGVCLGKDPVKLTLQYSCMALGSSIITVELSTTEVAEDRFTFSFRKRCTGVELSEGVSIEGLNIGTIVGGSDVVSDGITTEGFANAESWDEELNKNMVLYDARTPRVTFHVNTEFNEVVFRKPVLVLSRSWDMDGKRIALPAIEGTIVRAARIDRYTPVTLELVFNCQRNGSTDISVEIPIHPTGAMQFMVRKTCGVGDSYVPFDGFAPTRIPGLNVGLSKYGASVIKDGVPTKQADGKALYHWENDIRDLRYFAAQTSFVTFYVSLNRTQQGGESAVRLGEPELISSLNNARPMLSGRGSDGAVITQEGAYAAITITFHCVSNGTSIYNMEIPLLPLTSGEVAPRDDPIKIAFLKDCGRGKRSPKSGNGGVGINGFSIGTTKGGHEVVMNGFPTPLYYGQRNQDNPKWAPIIVNENTAITTVYLHLNSETAISNNVDKMTFQPITAVNHGHEVRPKLSGSAADGGTLSVDGKALTLDIVWNCRYAGLGAVTIVIPIYPHGKVIFTIPKRCTGPSRPQPKKVEGLMVGTEETVADVIDDGVVASKYENYRAYELGSVFVYDDTSTFWIWTEGEAPLKALEPVVVSTRPVATPQLSHTMHVQNGDGNDEETSVDIEITNTPQPITVFYNCVLVGHTAVTVVLPILPEGSQIAFTVTKACGNDEFEYTDYEYWDDAYSWSASDETYDSYYYSSSLSSSGYSDEYGYPSSSSSDYYSSYYYNYQENWDYSSGYSYSAPPSIDWGSIEEVRWNPVFDSATLYGRKGRALGWLNVGTGTGLDEIADVVNEGVPTKAYSVPKGTVSAEEDDTTSAYTVIGRGTMSAQYFISVPRDYQAFEAPFAKVQPDQYGREICAVALKGSSRYGGNITMSDAPMDLEVNFQCNRAGVARIIVSFPLIPYNFVSFRILKVCGNFSPKIEWYWTASRIMILGTTVLILVGALCLYRMLKSTKNPYSLVDDQHTDEQGQGLLNRKSHVDAFEEDVDSESD